MVIVIEFIGGLTVEAHTAFLRIFLAPRDKHTTCNIQIHTPYSVFNQCISIEQQIEINHNQHTQKAMNEYHVHLPFLWFT